MLNAENARGKYPGKPLQFSNFVNLKSSLADVRPCYSQVAQKREKANMSSFHFAPMFCICMFYATTMFELVASSRYQSTWTSSASTRQGWNCSAVSGVSITFMHSF